MRKFHLLILLLLVCATSQAQTRIRVWHNGEDDRMKIVNVGDMVFGDGTITLKDSVYNITDIDSIIVVPEITITYNNTFASVKVPASIAKDITVEQNGAHVTITNTNVSNEVELVLSGSSPNGSLTYNGSYKCTIQLDGLNLTSHIGSPLNIQCGKRVALELIEGTTNKLVDATDGEQKACLYCKGHLEISNAGTLSITANAKHGIATKEYLQLKRSTGNINIVKAAGDAIHAGQYFLMNGGTVTIDKNTLGDGIQVETSTLDDDTTPDPEKESNGQVIINGGTIAIDINSEDCKGIKCDSLVTINGGIITINANGNGSRGIQTDGSMIISGPRLDETKDWTYEQENDEGEKETIANSSTIITIAANGGLCTQEADKGDPHRCMGIKLEADLTVTGGVTTVTNTGTKSRGIKYPGTYTKTGGTIKANFTNK